MHRFSRLRPSPTMRPESVSGRCGSNADAVAHVFSPSGSNGANSSWVEFD